MVGALRQLPPSSKEEDRKTQGEEASSLEVREA